MNWLNENKDWLFSGLLVAIPLAVIGWFIASRANNNQSQKSGDNSTNIQAGGNITISKRGKKRSENTDTKVR